MITVTRNCRLRYPKKYRKLVSALVIFPLKSQGSVSTLLRSINVLIDFSQYHLGGFRPSVLCLARRDFPGIVFRNDTENRNQISNVYNEPMIRGKLWRKRKRKESIKYTYIYIYTTGAPRISSYNACDRY